MKRIGCLFFVFISVFSINIVAQTTIEGREIYTTGVQADKRYPKRNTFVFGLGYGGAMVPKEPQSFNFSLGYERLLFGNPEKEGYYIALEGRIRGEFMYDKSEFVSPAFEDNLEYNNKLIGATIVLRPAMEVYETLFLYAEGEAGLLYNKMKIGISDDLIHAKYYYANTLPFFGSIKIGLRYSFCSLSGGFVWLNTKDEINKIVAPYTKRRTDNIIAEFNLLFYF